MGGARPEGGRADAAPKVTAVIPVHNARAHTVACLEQLRAVTYPHLSVVVVDDGSTDGTAEEVARRFPEVRVARGDGSLYWSGGMNRGVLEALHAGADYVLSLNNDVTLVPDFLEKLVAFAEEHGAVVGPKICHATEPARIWQCGVERHWRVGLRTIGSEAMDRGQPEFNTPRPVASLTGLCVLIPRRVFDAVGLYDDVHFPMYLGDTDFVFRAHEAGFPVWVVPEAVIYNHVEHTNSFELRTYSSLGELLRAAFGIKSSVDPLLYARYYFRHLGPLRGLLPVANAWAYFAAVFARVFWQGRTLAGRKGSGRR